jgi:hypothetical protein
LFLFNLTTDLFDPKAKHNVFFIYFTNTKGFGLHGFSLRQVDVFVLDVVQVGDKLERDNKFIIF